MKTKPTSSVTGQAPVKTTTQTTRAKSIATMKQPAAVQAREKQVGSSMRGSARNPMLERKTHEDQHACVKACKGKY